MQWSNLIIPFFILIGLTACESNTYNKLLKSADHELKLKKAYEYYDAKDYYKAQTLFEQVMGMYRGTDQIEKIYFNFAYSHYYQEKYLFASHYFKTFSSTFPNSTYREEADYMVAYANYQLSPSFRLEQTYTLKAIDAFQLFINTNPESKRLDESNKLIDRLRAKLERKAYEEGILYFKMADYQAAQQSFKNVLTEYPDTKNAELIRFMIVKASYKLAQNSVESKKEERFKATITAFYGFKDKYPNSTYTKEAESYFNNSLEVLKSIK